MAVNVKTGCAEGAMKNFGEIRKDTPMTKRTAPSTPRMPGKSAPSKRMGKK